MKILIIGDIYSNVGRVMVKTWIAKIKKKFESEFKIALVIANGENTTHGKSLNERHYHELKEAGIDVITTGNHIFGHPDVVKYIDKSPDLLRPLNYNPYHPGNGTIVIKVGNKKVRVTNIIGRTFMDKADNPYYSMEQLLKTAQKNPDETSDIHIIDFHAEATAEKLAFAWNFDGQVTCVVGTHTHVQTADNRLLPKGTAFISDVGMTGPFYSIIGANPKEVIYRDKKTMPAQFKPADGEGQFSAVLLTINDKTNQAEKLERIFINPQAPNLKLNE